MMIIIHHRALPKLIDSQFIICSMKSKMTRTIRELNKRVLKESKHQWKGSVGIPQIKYKPKLIATNKF